MDRNHRLPNIEEFGNYLLRTGDLDPLYIALAGAALEREQLKRWLFAYWCCYNAGVSSWLSEHTGDDYWYFFKIMASNTSPTPMGGRWPRGHERRHWRGEKAIESTEIFSNVYKRPEVAVDFLISGAPKFTTIRERAISIPQFGPWIAFKAADMLERVMGIPIDFGDTEVMMYDQPYKSALIQWKLSPSYNAETPEKIAVAKVAKELLVTFRGAMAPPDRKRPIGIQEIETILCKWKSHNNYAYPIGYDSIELRMGLAEWAPYSATAERLYDATPGGEAQ
jgi:hypothetical protein